MTKSLNVCFSHPDGFISNNLESLKNESLKQSLEQRESKPNTEKVKETSADQVQVKTDERNFSEANLATEPPRQRQPASDSKEKVSLKSSHVKLEHPTHQGVQGMTSTSLINRPTAPV